MCDVVKGVLGHNRYVKTRRQLCGVYIISYAHSDQDYQPWTPQMLSYDFCH